MSISAVSTSAANQVAQTQHHGHAARSKAFAAAAKALGMSTDDLRTSLKSGQTLASLAKSKGVSTDTLTSTIASALTSANSSLSSDKAQQIAQQMVSGTQQKTQDHDGPSGGKPPNGPPPAVGKALDSLASTLGLTSDELKSKLQSGTSLTAIASSSTKKMDAATLKTTLTKALTTADSSLTADQASSIADKLIAGPQKPTSDMSSRLVMSRQGGFSSGTASSAASRALLSAKYSQYSMDTQSSDSDTNSGLLAGASL